MDLELREALRKLGATLNHLACSGDLPAELAGPAYQVMVTATLPPNETPKRVRDAG